MPSISISDLIGCKFTVHGRSIEEGFDCYGLAIEILKRAGIELPDVFYCDLENNLKTEKEIRELIKVERIEKPQELCIIVMKVKGEPTHIGIYLSKGNIIHATTNYGVIIEPLSRWKNRIEGYYKVSDSNRI